MSEEHPLVTQRRLTGGMEPSKVIEHDGNQVPVYQLSEEQHREVAAQELRYMAGQAGVSVEAFAAGAVFGASQLAATSRRSVSVVVPREAQQAVMNLGLHLFILNPPEGARAILVDVPYQPLPGEQEPKQRRRR